MAQAAAQTSIGAPSREDFAKLIDESFNDGHISEGAVVKGKVVAIERDLAVIDVGLKTEGRVAMREFQGPGRHRYHRGCSSGPKATSKSAFAIGG